MQKVILGAILGVGVAGFLSVMLVVGVFGGWQARLSDMLFLPRQVDQNIVLITIDDHSIQRIGRFPWDRSVHARLIEKLGQAPKVIGLDVSFPEESDVANDQLLAQALKKSGRVVIPATVISLRSTLEQITLLNYLLPIKVLGDVADLGVVNKLPSEDGVVRQTPINMKDLSGSRFENFSLQIVSKYLGVPTDQIRGQIPTQDGYMRINFVNEPKSFTSYSYIDVLDGVVPIETFSGKIVLIGATALDLHDNQYTPVSAGEAMDGVEIHANTIQTILEGKYLKNESKLKTIVAMLVVCVVVGAIVSFSRVAFGTVGVGMVLFGYLVFAFKSFDGGVLTNLIYPPLGMLVVYVVVVIYKYLIETRQKRFIRKALAYYLSEPVMRDVLRDPKKLSLGGERKEISVLFSDIAGFTSISEKIPAETLALLLNKYLTRMTKVVFKYNGVLDKYIGDAVMAFWGAPIENVDHAYLACETALEMQREIKEIKKEWSEYVDVDFGVRVGINTGEAVVGNMGSEMRFDYSLLGDTVNLGSRLEGINKEYGTDIIISGSTYEQVKDKVVARQIDVVAVKGKEKGVAIYELRDLGRPDVVEREFLEKFEQARSLYHKGEFKKALHEFEKLNVSFAGDGPIEVYVQRCKHLVKHVPENWDGVYHATSK